MFVSLVTLIISSTIFVYNDLKGFRNNLLKNLTALAGTVGANSRAAVYFGDKETATEILASLKEDPQIQYAVIYDSSGEVFVTYHGEELIDPSSQPREDVFLLFSEGAIELKRPIILKGNKIGDIQISADLSQYNAVIKKYLLIVGATLFFTLCIAVILSFVLQNFLSKPIQTLATAIKEISIKNDYSIRVDHQYKDEIGDLYMGFNQMISKIEKREKELTFKNVALKKEIEQRGHAEDKLKFYTGELERSNQELNDFSTIASHDLQEPLRKIITFGDLLSTQTPEIDEKGKQYLDRMQNAAQRMKQFIDDLLEYSKIDAKTKSFENTDLNKIFAEALENLEVLISNTQTKISCDKLPSIEVDSLQFLQLFQNLIANAIKYKKPQVFPIIHVNARLTEKGFWEISIKDNGIGFETKYLDRIFKPFERLHGKSEYEGSGMGLTICQKIVYRHGGSISATSIHGEGSTFKITIPESQSQKKTPLAFPLENNQKIT